MFGDALDDVGDPRTHMSSDAPGHRPFLWAMRFGYDVGGYPGAGVVSGDSYKVEDVQTGDVVLNERLIERCRIVDDEQRG